MRLLAVVVLLLAALTAPAGAADPPGGPGWYQLSQDITVTVPTRSGDLVIAGGTPGFLVSTTSTGMLRIRFERGIATWLGREITSDEGFSSTLTVDIDPAMVRAFVKQPLSKAAPGLDASPTRGAGGGPATLGPLDPVGTSSTTGGGGGTIGVQRDTVVAAEDTVRVLRAATPEPAMVPPARRGGIETLPPMSSAARGSAGGTTRVIAREEHDVLLAKLLRFLAEEDASCEPKSYGSGWVSICQPKSSLG